MIRASTTTRRTPRFRRPPTSHPPTSHPRYQPEPLEGRTLLAVFFVGDDAEGVFRDLNTAIALANSNPGPDTIEFRLKPHQLRLTLGSVYNPITDPLTIDGTSQPGFNGTPIVELDGGAVPRATVLPGLTVRAPGCTLRGLVIHSFPRQGIKLDDGSGGATIEQNYIGTDVSGTVARGNGLAGVQVHDSANNTIRRNLISGNGESGIFISSAAATGNRVEGNLIGTDASGMNPLGNAFNGVALAAPDVPFLRQGNDPADGYATGNFIGGRDPAARNVISGNRNTGVFIFRGVSNIVEGNYIGVGPDGITPVPNGPDGPDAEFGADGVAIEEGTNNGIGGVEAGAGNVISGNTRAGVRIRAVTRSANRNWVQGNLIGTDNNGNFNLSLGNGGSGVEIRNESTDSSVIVFDTLVGGDDADDGSIDGVIKARNIISGNLSAGVLLVGHLVLETRVRGNYIGTNKDGTAAIPNLGAGIDLTTFENQTAGPTHTQIGGTTPGAGNLLSGNESEGVLIQGATTATHVEGNQIGLRADGLPLGNGRSGVRIVNSSGNFVGGTTEAARNVISANGRADAIEDDAGVVVAGLPGQPPTSNNLVRGNYIGTDRGGNVSDPDGQPGTGDEFGNVNGVIVVDASGNHVGTAEDGGGNVIAGNTESGVAIAGGLATGNFVRRNLVGLGADGSTRLGNKIGVQITAGVQTGLPASANHIGGESGAARNVISGNRANGVAIAFGAFANRVQGNYIGTTANGAEARANDGHGVSIVNSPGNTIGGATAPPGAAPGNVISGNKNVGVFIGAGVGATGNHVLGNIIGLNDTGTTAVPNGTHGVQIESAGNFIGGTIFDTGNVISGNREIGVVFFGATATRNELRGNFIGTDARGTGAIGNGTAGVVILNAPDNTIGGAAEGQRNVISGNKGPGVYVSGRDAIFNEIHGNYVGTNYVGTARLGNAGHGVHLDDVPNTFVGGVEAGTGNVISANTGHGVVIAGANARGNDVHRNRIGTDLAGVTDLGNERHGVFVELGASDNEIGNPDEFSDSINTIRFNGRALGRRGHGVVIVSGTGNAVRRNHISDNAGRGIDLGNDRVTFNDIFVDPKTDATGGDPDTGANNLQDYPVVTAVVTTAASQTITWALNSTANSTFTIDLFSNPSPDASGFGEGATYLGSLAVTTDARGNASFSHTSAPGTLVSATATDAGGNTSEFSMIDSDADALADAWETTGIDYDEDGTVDMVLVGADPHYKDVYVEVDAMSGLAPTQATLDLVALAFAAAPVLNPNGSTGIRLHAQLDDIITREAWTGDLDGDGVDALGGDRNGNGEFEPQLGEFPLAGDPDDQGGFPYFKLVKQGLRGGGGFGTAQERADPNPSRLAAKRLVSRYAIFADRWARPDSDGVGTRTSVSGISEFGGNDIIISLGNGWDNTPEEQAGTFMHELGHTLGLEHGGADEPNYKPNYHSVMNYLWQSPLDWSREDTNNNGRRDYDDANKNGQQDPGEQFVEYDANGNGFFGDDYWSLDYSDQAFPDLDERNLDENAGVGGHAAHWVYARGPQIVVPESGPVDWNGRDADGNGNPADETGLSIDLNKDRIRGTLNGHDDWAAVLKYYFLESGFLDEGAAPQPDAAEDEMDIELFEELNAGGLGPGVLEFRVRSFEIDEAGHYATITVRRGGGTRGAVTVDFFTADGTATAGQDYTPVSGTLTFAAGEFRKTFSVPIIADAAGERTEAVRLVLTNPTGGAMLSDENVATLNIVDDDGAVFFVVTNTNDTGPGSLRQAILDANARPGRDFIDFNVGGGGVQTIALISGLPRITDPVEIDATTQPGFAGAPIIELSGQIASGAVGLHVSASDTTVRGLVINRFHFGIQVSRLAPRPAPSGVRIGGNFIGTDVTGLLPRGNAFGVFWNAPVGTGNRIGGTSPTARNVISANRFDGVQVVGTGLTIQGNLIGIGADGATPLGNGNNGVFVFTTFDVGGNSTIGGLEPGAGNVIAFNQWHGVWAHTPAAVLSNSIHSNGLLGINQFSGGEAGGLDLNDVELGLSVRTAHTDDGAPGDPQNYPVLTSAVSAGGQTTISGHLGSRADETFLLQFFGNTTVEPSGFGQGRTLLGSASVTTGADGRAEFTVTLPVALPHRHLLTATATGARNETSEFSRRLAVGDVLTSVYTVNTTDDVDDGIADATHTSLREAIHAANNHAGPDLIRFAIGSGVRTIAPLTPLPAIVDTTTIDGTTQPGFAGTPVIELIGTLMERVNRPTSGFYLTGLYVVADNSTVRGLVINRFFEFGSDPNLIGGNALVVLGNGNVVEGNFIGTDVTGTQALTNLGGIGVRGAGNRVGGTTVAARNLISGNRAAGLGVAGTDGVIQGNFIGTDVTGTRALPNGDAGPGGPGVGVSVLGRRHLVGGAGPGEGNLISGNGTGLGISSGSQDGGPSGIVVRGNFIGTDVTGTRPLGNRAGDGMGIRIDGSQGGVTVGGTLPGEGNVIADNRIGIFIFFSPDNVIQGNFIGADVTGTLALGNGDGVVARGDRNLVGGTDPAAGNTIAFNAGAGVKVLAARGVAILSNSIHSNGALGIDLAGDGVTPNDPADADAGGNDLQNFPVLTEAATDGARSQIGGTLDSRPNITYLLQFFSSPAADPSGFGEGRVLLGTRFVTTDDAGNAGFTFTFSAAVPLGHFVSATATETSTDPANSTSEFSRAVAVADGTVAPNRPPTARVGGPYEIDEGSPLTLVGAASTDPDGDELTYAWDVNGDGVFGDATGVSPTLSWQQLKSLGITDGPASSEVRVRVDDGQGHVVTSAAAGLTVRNVAPAIQTPDDQFVTETDPVTFTAAFTDPGDADSHTLRWRIADANDPHGTVAEGAGASIDFMSADDGTFLVHFTVSDDDGGVGSTIALLFVNNADPVASIVGLPATGSVGVPIHVTPAVTDRSPVDAAAGFTYEWFVVEEGSDEAIAEGTGPAFSFTPPAAGRYEISLAVFDKDGGAARVRANLAVTETPAVAPAVTLGPDGSVDEGSAFTAVGSFLDPDAADTWAATVDYGDGTGPQPLALGTDKTFDLGHVYADDGVYDVTVTITDGFGLAGSDTARVTVRNVAPLVVLAPPAPATVGTAFILAGSFADPGADTWAATVDYGDGTGPRPLALAADGTFTLDHTYDSAGSFTTTVTVTDDGGATGVATRTIVVNRIDTALAAAPASATYGGAATLSATLTAGAAPIAGEAVLFQINGVVVGTATTGADGTAVLADVPLGSLPAGAATISATFAQDDRHAGAAATAQLTIDKAPLLVTVDDQSRVYGQDNPPFTGTLTGLRNGDDVAALYTTAATPTSPVGTYPVGAALQDPDGRLANYGVTVDGGTLTVVSTTLNATGRELAAAAGAPASGVVAGFTTDNPIALPSDFTATIDWGDGGSSEGVVRAAATGGFEVFAEHVYAAAGAYPVTVIITDNAGLGTATTSSRAVVTDADNTAPAVTITGPAAGSVHALGTAVSLVGSFADADAGDTHTASWTITAEDGSQVLVPGVVHPGGRVTGSRAFAAAGIYHVSLTVVDSAGNAATATTAGGAEAAVVVVDRTAHVTGGGWFDPPAGAASDPTHAGRASFGFNASYHGDGPAPTGQLQFRAGRLNFHSTSFDWLIVRGAKARLRGTGTINGRGRFAFLLTFVDGRQSGRPDTVRMTIWDPAADVVLYDSGAGAGEEDDFLTELGGGGVTIHA